MTTVNASASPGFGRSVPSAGIPPRAVMARPTSAPLRVVTAMMEVSSSTNSVARHTTNEPIVPGRAGRGRNLRAANNIRNSSTSDGSVRTQSAMVSAHSSTGSRSSRSGAQGLRPRAEYLRREWSIRRWRRRRPGQGLSAGTSDITQCPRPGTIGLPRPGGGARTTWEARHRRDGTLATHAAENTTAVPSRAAGHPGKNSATATNSSRHTSLVPAHNRCKALWTGSSRISTEPSPPRRGLFLVEGPAPVSHRFHLNTPAPRYRGRRSASRPSPCLPGHGK